MNHSSFTRELVRAFGPRLPLVTASAGPWSPDGLLTDGDTVAMVVTDGLMLREVQLGSARAVEILGAGDVFEVGRIAGKVLADEERFEVPQSATIAAVGVLPPDVLARAPAVAHRLLTAGAQRTRRQLRHRAAVQLPRVEDRLLAVLWLIAERYGTLTEDGVDVGVELRHDQLGRLVGAQRPTVTTAVTLLCEQGLIRRPGPRRVLLEPSSRKALGLIGEVAALPG